MDTGNRMSQASRRDYLQRIYPRYQKASRPERQRILDEFCANCSYHRKHAIRLLNRPLPAAKTSPRRRAHGRTYGSQAISVLKAVWAAADYPWSVRLKALLPEWMPWIRRRFRLTPEIERQRLRISARSIDLPPGRREAEVAASALRSHQARDVAETSHPAQDGSLGCAGAGLHRDRSGVAFGHSASGDFCYSLNLTDMPTGWTETQAVLGKSQEAVRAALETIRPALPFSLRGIDSDNGSEFINDHLYRYCQAGDIQFTRGRPYKKDDHAHIEQKNWTHVRRLLGSVCYDSQEARDAINDRYRHELRRFQNLFLPSVKLAKKERVGSRLRRRYAAPLTPLQRLAAGGVADPVQVAELQCLRQSLDPFSSRPPWRRNGGGSLPSAARPRSRWRHAPKKAFPSAPSPTHQPSPDPLPGGRIAGGQVQVGEKTAGDGYG